MELGSGRMTKVMMTEPARMPVTLMRLWGTPSADDTSLVKEATTCVRAGLPSGMASMVTGTVASTCTGAGFSLMAVKVPRLVDCPPPVLALPTVMRMSPLSCSPVLGMSVQMALMSDTTVMGVHGMGVAPCMRPVTTAESLPKLRPVMVTLTGSPASTCCGATDWTVGASKLIQLLPMAICSCEPERKWRMSECRAPTHEGDWHDMRVPSWSLTTSEVQALARVRSTLPAELRCPM
mmetsp:Transcript_59667/g.122398  ORF Transcript_59667/g.122398 Transcript_59667/m.122398 type:complete len:236 (+) Transcript_59667:485-1192(+)